MMRLVFSADLIITIILLGQYMGSLFNDYTTGQRLTVAGTFAFMVAVLAAQSKAARLDVPFDGYSWALLTTATILNVGLMWSLVERRPWKRE